jgi:hypothetical protein
MVRNENKSHAGRPLIRSIIQSSIRYSNHQPRSSRTTRLKQICAYADDIVIFGRTKQVLTDTFLKLKQEALKSGLTLNVKKPNIYIVPENPTNKTT